MNEGVVNKMEWLRKALQNNLPGEKAQQLMAPALRNSTSEYLKQQKSPKVASVLLLLFENEDKELQLILTRRQDNLGVHSSQISFPGGKVEEGDESHEKAALRETQEEIGIPISNLEIIGKLSPLYIPVSNFLVHPHVAFTPSRQPYILQENEVAEVLEVSISHFLAPENIYKKKVRTSYGVEIEAPYFDVFGHHVWGATAMMLSEFAEIIRLLNNKNSAIQE